MKKNLIASVLSLLMLCIFYIPSVCAETEPQDKRTAGHGFYEESGSLDLEYDDAALLNDYAQAKLNEAKGLLYASNYSGRQLLRTSPGQATVYFLLKDEIRKIADGERTSTEFSGTASDLLQLGLIDKTRFSASELGFNTIGEHNKVTVFKALLKEIGLTDIKTALVALMDDCPYELYWFNKTNSGGYKYSYNFNYDQDASGEYYMELTHYVFRLTVADTYAQDRYIVKSDIPDAVNRAVRTAKEIVREGAGYSDRDKLEYYCRRICELTSYNSAAAMGGINYGDPWQIIYVFDRDPQTNVVCEGYAKSFSYLCELSSFEEYVACYLVSGYTTENHMWNIVNLHGINLLVDVTNCDGGIGTETQLFLTGYDKGSVEDGYTVWCSGGSITYHYDSDTLTAYSTEALTLARKRTGSGSGTKNGLVLDDDGVYRYYEYDQFIPLTDIVDYDGGRFFVRDGVLDTELNGLNAFLGVWYFLAQGQIQDRYTGLALYDGECFLIVNGVLEQSFNGLLNYDGADFLVSAGRIRYDVSGLWNYSTEIGGDGLWYYLSSGQVQTQYTGLALYDGEWFYVTNGSLDTDLNGLVDYDGERFLVSEGRMRYDVSGPWVDSDGSQYELEHGQVRDGL